MQILKLSLKRKLFLFLTLFHFFIIIVISIQSSWKSIYEFYYGKDSLKISFPYKAVYFAKESPIVNLYSSFTGLDTGYGFFAPNVSSICNIEFEFYDVHNVLKKRMLFLPFNSREGYSRYSTFLGIFQDKMHKTVGEANKNNHIKYLDVVIKSVSRNLLVQNKSYYKVRANLYLYNYPTLMQHNAGTFPSNRVIPLESFIVVRK
jgi:hypothetical protein